MSTTFTILPDPIGSLLKRIVNIFISNFQGSLQLKQSFSSHCHSGSIRALSNGGKYVATGSTDETIYIYSMKKRAEHGSLHQHNGNKFEMIYFVFK